MASNPMQRRARNSFLLGVIITLLIAAIAGALFYMFVLKDKLETTGGTGTVAYVYKLKEGVNLESGREITVDMVEEVKTSGDVVPADVFFSRVKGAEGELQSVPFPSGYKSKIALKQGTILGGSMLYQDEMQDDSLRLVEFNMITLPSTIYPGEYVDVRIMFPSGEDFIILSKKCIKTVKNDTVGIFLTEEEIMTMSSAIVDAYTTKASNIYIAKYVEPGNQEKATQTYVVKQAILELMRDNPNIVSEAKNALLNRWNSTGISSRIKIENDLSLYQEDGLSNIEDKVKEQVEKSKELYLSGLEEY